jgi:diaminohydroxyphosphoribosylaminopyrimidine deaminase / 5-amino-6-(5-phosphoribosylamino)uracil reductase
MLDEVDQDIQWMREAIALGERGRLTAPPNPWVGSLIVDPAGLSGEGWHVRPGEPHAEVVALRSAGSRATGATLYATLEPCCHVGRTPPCADAIIRAGIRRVVVGIEDPDEKVRGNGITLLRRAGIEVEVGILAQEVSESLRPYLHHRRFGRPYCVAKAAVSVDGRIAASNGSSQWISGPEARAEGHALRARSQAVMVGVGTAIADSPALTARTDPPPPHQPLRIVVDSSGRFEGSGEGWLIATTEQAPLAKRLAWEERGAEVLVCEMEEDQVSLPYLLDRLGERGILQLLVEGGGRIHGSLLHQGLIDELHLFVGPVALGPTALPLFAGGAIESLEEAPRFTLCSVSQWNESARLVYVKEK